MTLRARIADLERMYRGQEKAPKCGVRKRVGHWHRGPKGRSEGSELQIPPSLAQSSSRLRLRDNQCHSMMADVNLNGVDVDDAGTSVPTLDQECRYLDCSRDDAESFEAYHISFPCANVVLVLLLVNCSTLCRCHYLM